MKQYQARGYQSRGIVPERFNFPVSPGPVPFGYLSRNLVHTRRREQSLFETDTFARVLETLEQTA